MKQMWSPMTLRKEPYTKMIIHQLFPTPVYVSRLERDLSKQELKTIHNYKKKTHRNEGNVTSDDTYVLENKTLKNLKEDLHKKLLDYFNKVLCNSNSITPLITQSWLNYTEPNEFHHKHFHSNSYVSGVFYIDANKTVDHIKFYKSHVPEIESTISTYNLFNARSLWFPVETGDVVLFPSSLPHGVDKKQGTNSRISLSFNSYFKGTIGHKLKLTELTI